jgi:hypothetical protein
MQDPEKLIPLKRRKPVWWKVIIGVLLLITHRADNELRMDMVALILEVVAIWLIISGVRPVWRKISN